MCAKKCVGGDLRRQRDGGGRVGIHAPRPKHGVKAGSVPRSDAKKSVACRNGLRGQRQPGQPAPQPKRPGTMMVDEFHWFGLFHIVLVDMYRRAAASLGAAARRIYGRVTL